MKMFLMFFTVLAMSQSSLAVKLDLEENSFAPAQAAPSPQYQEAVRKIDQVRRALKLTSASAQACDSTPTSANCTFESYCSKFADKAQSFYLYQDKDGHQVPNFQMIISLSFAEACLRQPFPQAAVADPFVYQEQLASAEKAGGKDNLKRNLERYNRELTRARGIFGDVQQRIIALLEKRRTPQNSSEISNMIARIKTVKFSSPKLGDGVYMLSAEGCEAPNAYYMPSRHDVTVCPQFLNLPDAALFSTISHELGHAIDPCSSVYSYSKGLQGELEMSTPEFMGGGGPQGKVVMSAIPPEKSPMKSVISCLQSPSSIGVKVPSLQEMISAVDKDEAALQQEALAEGSANEFAQSTPGNGLGDATLARFEDQRKGIRQNYARYKNCGAFSGSGHVQEAFADWVASQTLAQKVSEIQDSARARDYAFESQSVFWGAGCENLKQAATQRIQKAGGKECSTFEEAAKALNVGEGASESSHPATANRINRILFAKPEIQKALGCKSPLNSKECQ